MTQQETLEYNKRCAEFLGDEGMQKICSDNGHHYPSIDEMKFDSDWNWIMEVIEAIEKLKYNVTIHFHPKLRIQSCSIYNEEGKLVSMRESNHISKKEAVVQAINQFLIWYNEQRT